jgi:hypothetical protein
MTILVTVPSFAARGRGSLSSWVGPLRAGSTLCFPGKRVARERRSRYGPPCSRIARQLGHTNAEIVYRRYHMFIPNLRGCEEAHAARWLAGEGL